VTAVAPLPACEDHVAALARALAGTTHLATTARRWGNRLAELLPRGHRLLAAGNGGSAAQAQHLTAELVGRFRDDRPAFSAIPLHTDTSTMTALVNDYGADELFARQVRAHGRPGDVLVLMSTSGRSSNLLTAAAAAAEVGMETWALTGPCPNPLAAAADDVLAVEAPATATVQEIHLVAVHALCLAFDSALLAHATPRRWA
jgi:D-sedoheptulose 7-phosphate isomerase